ncbi:MAG TPA: CPBP family intramembrane metalloprotease domain-containing protein [Verrucomicrobiales bacterium]|nr:CPBP family intramembrane metalloprotease domain-containing protein [Verrucomicrobiales bacterium]
MIRWHLVTTLFRKEITETLRDRRTLLMAVGLPVLLYPLIAMALTKLQESRAEGQEATPSRVALWGEFPEDLRRELGKTNRFALLQWGSITPEQKGRLQSGETPPLPPLPVKREKGAGGKPPAPRREAAPEHPLVLEARRVLSERSLDAVLLAWPGFQPTLGTGGLAQVYILYDSVRDSSRQAMDRLEESLERFRKLQVERRETDRGLPAGFARAVAIEDRNVAPQERQVGRFLGAFLPFLLIVLSASGGLYATIDLTAGEKERNTLQTLLCAPMTSLEIISGKFLAAWVIVLLTTLANLLSMAATFARILSSAGGFETPASSYLLAFVVLLPATFTLTALFLAVAVFARDFKDGQNLLTPMFMILTLPLGATTLPDIELNAWTAFVPLVNIALLIKGVFLAEAKADLVFLTLLSSAVYAGLALLLAARVFQQEQVLLGGRDSWRSLLHMAPTRRPVPTASFSLTAFALVFVLVFYASHLLQGRSTVVMILGTQLGFFLLPNILIGWRWGFSWTETYQFRKPSAQAILGAVLIGLSAWGVTAGIVTRVFPPPETFTKALEKVLLFEGQNLPLWVVWLVLGVTPAVCEELFFRGLVMAGFRRLGMWPALVLSSLLFAVAHSSIYRLLPTFALGMIIGYCTWNSRSMITGMVIHSINNSLLVTFLHMPELAKRFGFDEMATVPWSLTLVTLASTVLGVWLVRRGSRGLVSPPG